MKIKLYRDYGNLIHKCKKTKTQCIPCLCEDEECYYKVFPSHVICLETKCKHPRTKKRNTYITDPVLIAPKELREKVNELKTILKDFVTNDINN